MYGKTCVMEKAGKGAGSLPKHRDGTRGLVPAEMLCATSGEVLALARWPMASRNCSGPVKKNVTGRAWPVTF